MAQISKKKALDIIDNLISQVKKIENKDILGELSSGEIENKYLLGESSSEEIIEIVENIRTAISRMFGPNSSQLQKVEKLTSAILTDYYDRSTNARELRHYLQSFKYEIETFWEDEGSISEEKNLKPNEEVSESRKFSTNKVFIIHGHDEGTKEKVARFLEKIGLNPIILPEKPDEGQTIIEKFEKHSLYVGFAIALLTPDDVCNSRLNEENLNYRARQNVIFELGYFVGKLGRKRVCALIGKDVEIPSDYSGILYIPLEGETWKFELAKELKNAGFEIDMNKVL